jgi:hypothetical protein
MQIQKASSRSPGGPLSFPEIVTIVWFVLDAFTHLSIEAAYCLIALHDTGILFMASDI